MYNQQATRGVEFSEPRAVQMRCAEDVAMPKGAIESRLESILSATAELGSCVNRLESRIEAVLRPEGPTNANGKEDGPKPNASGLANVLTEYERQIVALISRVNSMRDRVEL